MFRRDEYEEDYKTVSSRKSVSIIAFIPLLILVLYLLFTSLHGYIARETAEEFLNEMYHFTTVESIDKRYDDIKKLVTDDVYEEVTSLDRTLRAYLKMQGNPSQVHILAEGDGYIIYELICDSLTPGRKFMLIYEMNMFGKLDMVREMEVADFI